MKKTLVVNLFAGAGAGKSTLSADTFAELKYQGINAEYVPEFAKDAVWEGRNKVFNDQAFIFGEQHYRLSRLLGEVDVVVTDSPIILSAFYNEDLSQTFEKFVLEEFHKFSNLNFFVCRVKPYNPKGRFQTEAQAKQDDVKLLTLLDRLGIYYTPVKGERESVPIIVDRIKKELDK